jgi:hypothetical protein
MSEFPFVELMNSSTPMEQQLASQAPMRDGKGMEFAPNRKEHMRATRRPSVGRTAVGRWGAPCRALAPNQPMAPDGERTHLQACAARPEMVTR